MCEDYGVWVAEGGADEVDCGADVGDEPPPGLLGVAPADVAVAGGDEIPQSADEMGCGDDVGAVVVVAVASVVAVTSCRP